MSSKTSDIKINSLTDTVQALIDADKALCDLDASTGWTESTRDFPEWRDCGIIDPNRIPKVEILRKPGEANGKEHGKRFEENLKLITSVALSDNAILSKDESTQILNRLNCKGAPSKKKQYSDVRKYNTIPMSRIYFLEETEHINDEKDVDTNQVLTGDSRFIECHKKLELNPLKKEHDINSKWEWNWDEMEGVRNEAKSFMGSGMNIKCAQMSTEEGEFGQDSYRAWPNPVDCANCMTFHKETYEGNWIFVIGVWKYIRDTKDKCIKGVWFIQIEEGDGDNFWGCKDNTKNERTDELEDINDKIMALKRFNKARKSGKVSATIQRPHLKGLYYYGDIERAKARCKNAWTSKQEAEVKKEKAEMAYGGCVPILELIKKKMENTAALLRLTAKVQVDVAQTRLQCNISTSNFKRLVEEKMKQGKAIFKTAKDFTFLFRPIKLKGSKKGSKKNSTKGSTKTGKGGGIQQGGGSDVYNTWLTAKNAIESKTDFFFDEEGTACGYPIFLDNKINKKIKTVIDTDPEKFEPLLKESYQIDFTIPEEIRLSVDPGDEGIEEDEDTEEDEDEEEEEEEKEEEKEEMVENKYIVLPEEKAEGIHEKLLNKISSTVTEQNVLLVQKLEADVERMEGELKGEATEEEVFRIRKRRSYLTKLSSNFGARWVIKQGTNTQRRRSNRADSLNTKKEKLKQIQEKKREREVNRALVLPELNKLIGDLKISETYDKNWVKKQSTEALEKFFKKLKLIQQIQVKHDLSTEKLLSYNMTMLTNLLKGGRRKKRTRKKRKKKKKSRRKKRK